MVRTYNRQPPVFHRGKGCYLWDLDNRQYLDFTAGIAVNGLGHADPGVARVLSQQAQVLVHVSNLYHNPWIGALSQLLVETTRSSGGMSQASRAFICNSGSEANEAAIKFARKYGRHLNASGAKHELVCFHGGFHGRTLGSLSATFNKKYQEPFTPLVPGFRFAPLNSVEEATRQITADTCGVIVEPIQGEGGVHVAELHFLEALRARCDEVGALLVFDEIQCGLSRTGRLWAHSSLPKTAHPDILTTAKALGNGVPIGATLVTEKVSSLIVPGDHGTTFGGNPLAASVAHHVLTRLAEPAFQAAVRRKGRQLHEGLTALQKKFPNNITELRGTALIVGVQLTGKAAEVVTAARERGLLLITAGHETLRIVPPLVIVEHEITEGLKLLEDAFNAVFRHSVEGMEKPAR